MARPEKFTDDQKKIAFDVVKTNHEVEAKQVVNAVKTYLLKKTMKDIPSMTEKEAIKLVEQEQLSPTAITAYVSDLKREFRVNRPIDDEWTLECQLSLEWRVSPQVLPVILSMKKQGYRVTIRIARWMDWFYYVPVSKKATLKIAQRLTPEYRTLWLVAYDLADAEKQHEISGIPVDYKSFESSTLEEILDRRTLWHEKHIEDIIHDALHGKKDGAE